MSELQQRLARLSPRQRQVLEVKMQMAGLRLPPDPAVPVPLPKQEVPTISKELLLPDESPSAAEVKEKTRQFYSTVSRQLDSSLYGPHARFLNIGYLDDHSPPQRTVQMPDRTLNRACINLVLEMLGGCPLDNTEILDIGCGRGGTIHILATLFTPLRLTGIDLCPEAIAFCRRNDPPPTARFLTGDAERLPFRANSFHRVTNLESSHNYPDIEAFYSEAARVLRPGGRFLYSDILPRDKWEKGSEYLRRVGLRLALQRDITANVLLSCRATGGVHLEAFTQANDPEMMRDFLGLEGSRPYRDMADGIDVYFIQHWEKADGV